MVNFRGEENFGQKKINNLERLIIIDIVEMVKISPL
jgi:hypothetical protein